MNSKINGTQLYGNDFDIHQIEQWYKEEEEAYAQLEGVSVTSDSFSYIHLDSLFGFSKLPHSRYYNVLGLGASWGYEFLPIIDKVDALTIVESSDYTKSTQLGNIVPTYLKANVSGAIDANDSSFGLVTCFCVLHHIPNVSFVISELIRVLSVEGCLLIREPIHSMGDWSSKRSGLTKNERGIHYKLLEQFIDQAGGEIVHKTYHFFMYSFLKRLLGNPQFLNSKWYLKMDNYLSHLFLWNFHYHPQNKWQRVAPQLVYYVIKKKRC